MPKLTNTAIWLMVLSVSGSQAWSADIESARGVEFFEKHIRPLFSRHCYRCHSERADRSEGGLLLDRRRGWIEGGDSGESVVLGDPDNSLLIEAVRYEDAGLQMPPSEPLSAAEVDLLERWVQLGAPGPADDQAVELDDPSDPVAGRGHWAFQPLQEVEVPQAAGSWPRTAIDQFIWAGLEREGLQPVPDARPADLARRLYFQLTGLPPSAEQITEFSQEFNRQYASDGGASATQRLIDRLLATPQYGERWGRHWLDLARYADSNGLDENFLFREAWRYRNWVIRAVAADMPFDRFLVEQIAGDLLPYESIEQRDNQRIAAGFLVVGPKVLLGIDKDQQRMDVADELIDTIGRTVLAQTLGCARCHDHKFDPFPTADYYALAGIFTSTRVMERRHMLNQQRLMEQLIGLGPNGNQLDEAYEDYWRSIADRKQRKLHAEAALELLQKIQGSPSESDRREGSIERPPRPPQAEREFTESFARVAQEHSDAIAPKAAEDELALAERIAAQREFVKDLEEQIANPPPIPPRAMSPQDVEQPADEAIRMAGQVDAHGEVVPRGFLTVLNPRSSSPSSESRGGPAVAPHESGRLALARWLTDGEQPSGQLAARVMANRVWQHLIGRGLVRTTDNFGRTGEPPTHPELLDYLADRLIASGWSVKALVREIAASRTFALSTRFDAHGEAVDPENRWLWRGHRRRLEPEALRDAMLAAAGQLDMTPMDSTVFYLGDQATAVGANKNRRRTDFPCRSVYLPVIRNDLPEIFESFDFADPHTTTGARPKTIVPMQGLFMLNDEMVMQAAEATAERLLAECQSQETLPRIDHLFKLVLGSPPTAAQRDAVQRFLNHMQTNLAQSSGQSLSDQQSQLDHSESGGTLDEKQVELRAWTAACHALFASSRFQFLD